MEVGFFGKVLTHGDFVSRRFPRPFLDAWDQWLQAGILDSREVLGDDWLATYLGSPLWHFALGEGLGFGGAVIGVMMPSVDKVGRKFPLTVATQLPPAAHLPAILASAGDWFGDLDDLMRGTLTPDFQLEAFDAALTAPYFQLDTLVGDPVGALASAAGSRVIALPSGQDFASALAGQASQILAATLAGYSLWWTEGLDSAPLLVVQPGMPPPTAFAGLLGGRWS